MTSEARLAATIELFQQVRQAALTGGAAADTIIRGFFRRRRYAGSKDRRNISENVYAMLHDHEALAWRVRTCGGEVCARSLTLAWRLAGGRNPEEEFTGAGYGPEPLGEAERVLSERLSGLDRPPPEFARLNCPEGLEPALRARFGKDFGQAMQALNQRGPATFRVNSLKMSREEAIEKLGLKGAHLVPTRHAPCGLSLLGETGDLRGYSLFRNGALEVQNEASQIASLLAEARPGMQVLELCAGAGGKSLALAASMENKGQIYAADISARRLGRLKDRYRRAGVRNIQTMLLPEGGDAARRDILASCMGAMDRVVVDAPCSGTGTWKHNPELRLRAGGEWLESLRATQRALLNEAAAYAKPGARLVYMTCSLLGDENEAQIEAFLADHGGWSIAPYTRVWRAAGASPADGLSALAGTLQLGPVPHGTDGFFVAVLKAP